MILFYNDGLFDASKGTATAVVAGAGYNPVTLKC